MYGKYMGAKLGTKVMGGKNWQNLGTRHFAYKMYGSFTNLEWATLAHATCLILTSPPPPPPKILYRHSWCCKSQPRLSALCASCNSAIGPPPSIPHTFLCELSSSSLY